MDSLNEANEFFLKFLRRITLKSCMELTIYSLVLLSACFFFHYSTAFKLTFSLATVLSFAILLFNTKNSLPLNHLDFIGFNLMYFSGVIFFALLPSDSFAITLIFVAALKGVLKTKAYFILGTERTTLSNTLFPLYAIAILAVTFSKKFIPEVPSSNFLKVFTISFALTSTANAIRDFFTLEKCKAFLDSHINYFDQLTSVYNRKLLGEWGARTDIAAIAYIDIDTLKAVNDSFGQATGDKVLIYLCNEVTRRIKGDDNIVFVRDTGDKFLLICKIFDDASRKLIINLIDYYRNNPIEVNGLTVNITLSIGVYQNLGGETLERMITEGDNLLYYAKTNGKNCLVIDYRKVH